MEKSIDVLAWFGDCNGDTPNDRAAREVRDAVAELIEVCQTIEAYRAVGAAPLRVPTATWERWRAALARAQGGAA